MDKSNNQHTELAVTDTSIVQNLIYTIRNQQVMLDFDLAVFYGYDLRSMNQQVKRNIARFPDDFMFQLTREEVESVKSQIVISRKESFFSGQDGGRRTLPFAFTEQGIYMLATVLKGSLAEQLDGYIDTDTLDLLSKKKKNVPVKIYTFNRGNQITTSEIQKFNTQYPSIDIKINESFHDRFLIIDNKTCYHIGASLKDAGKKSFALTVLEDFQMVKDILTRL